MRVTEFVAHNNATLCYQTGLRYCVNKKGGPLYLKAKKSADSSKAKVVKIEEDEMLYTI